MRTRHVTPSPSPTAATASRQVPDTLAGQARREQILRASAEVLADVGYAKASVGRIAQHLGISKGVITYHFPSKDDLLRQVALTVFRACEDHLSHVRASRQDPAARLRARIQAELDFFALRGIEFRAMAEVMENHRDEEFLKKFNDVSAHDVQELATLLTDGQAACQFRDFEAEAVAHLIIAAKNDVLDRWAGGAIQDLPAAAETLVEFVNRAVLADSGSPRESNQ